ncbi:MAG: hypothetical protein WCO56_10045 [Verrucomicrobiota bacterium]
MSLNEWNPVTKGRLILFGLGILSLFYLLWRAGDEGLPLLDHANLVFHEAGHPVIGIFSSRLEPYGGTFGQLCFPIVLAITFWRKQQPISYAIALVWFFENFIGIARYMADSRALLLPLVGGGGHDWNHIFFSWGILSYDTRIAAAVKIMGWLGMSGISLWVLWRGWLDRHRAVS